MPVTGARETAARLRRYPQRVRDEISAALDQGAAMVLQDMNVLTPRDAANPGQHAADGLTIVKGESDLVRHIGLPTAELANDFFWFRFLDGGTKGGEVTARRNGKRVTVRVPARPALRIRERALDGNMAEIETLIRQALVDAGATL